jgi:2-polyprenyl-6-methoxyphenol hydroxylase-like FAD-dependent oxidoreductase
VAEEAGAFYRPGIIFMACGQGGYVGLVRVERDRLDVAAALDPAAVRHGGSPGLVVSQILNEAGYPALTGHRCASWQGTLPLTQRVAAVAGERLFVVGDAAGYVEPFTGEGMAWALESAQAVTPLVVQAARRWSVSLARQWVSWHHTKMGPNHSRCRILVRALRYPRFVRGVLEVLKVMPAVAGPVLTRLNAVRNGAGTPS